MKKLFLLVAVIATICLTGCGKVGDKEIRNNFIKEIEGLKSYYMEGTLKLTNNDDNYEYDIEVSYQKDDNYKVSLINKGNDYEQIILKNKEGVYVITPSLNKSFKFQSDWPNNNSQSYLLTSVAKDLKDDSAYKFTQKDKDYIFTTKTNYPNNPKYVKQNIILDKKFDLKKVEVKDDQDITYIEFTVKKIDKKANFSENEFSLEEITKDFKTQEENDNSIAESEKNDTNDNNQKPETNQEEENLNQDSNQTEETEEPNNTNETEENSNQTEESNTNQTSKVDENVFPLYLPSNTSLSDKEVIETTNGERVIMTFSGDNPFILVQETVKPSKELEIIPTYGEPFMLIDTVGSLTDTSYTWTSNGVEYYIVSDQMDKTELLEVAKSINVVSAINEK
ncbi:MAG: hypothetical protein ACI4PE_04045 [Bacilli bacterium]